LSVKKENPFFCRQSFQVSTKTIILIAGPTAVGKTGIGIAIARHFGAEIISADSRQCFKEMNIGVARPSEEELAQVPHHFIATHSIHEKVTAATFEEYALQKAAMLFQHHNQVVMVGGTGLYIKAFTEGMDPVPQVPENMHEEVVIAYHQNGLAWLQDEVKKFDPLFAQHGEMLNPQRLMRALEVVRATGRSLLSFRTGQKKTRPFMVKKIGLELQKEQLHQQINLRVDKMMAAGLLEEVKGLLPFQHLNALQTVGYKELFAYYQGEVSLHQAVDAIKQNTRHYAKRQLTWFRKDPDLHWLSPDAGAVKEFLTRDVSISR
jgi:tRNA dimethylallyltransferase